MGELMLDVGQANELKFAFRRARWSNAEIKKLCEGNLLTYLLPIVRQYEYGTSKVVMSLLPIIDCDADPFIPVGWVMQSHIRRGLFVFDPTKIELYLSPDQQDVKSISGDQLYPELVSVSSVRGNKFVLNANVLDFLLAHKNFIPKSWEKDKRGIPRSIFFWGTIYSCPSIILYSSSSASLVRCLQFNVVGGWHTNYKWINNLWFRSDPAAMYNEF